MKFHTSVLKRAHPSLSLAAPMERNLTLILFLLGKSGSRWDGQPEEHDRRRSSHDTVPFKVSSRYYQNVCLKGQKHDIFVLWFSSSIDPIWAPCFLYYIF
jgi:hypothetical protein